MRRLIVPVFLFGVLASGAASAQMLPSTPPMVVMVPAQSEVRGNLGGVDGNICAEAAPLASTPNRKTGTIKRRMAHTETERRQAEYRAKQTPFGKTIARCGNIAGRNRRFVGLAFISVSYTHLR